MIKQNKKIAIINSMARTKSTGKIAYGFYSWLKNLGYDVTLFYGRDDFEEQEEGVVRIGTNLDVYTHVFCSRLFGDQGLYSRIATRKLVSSIVNAKIDVVYLLNIHGYYLCFPMLFSALRKEGISIIYVMVDEYPFRGKCCFQTNCERFINECSNCPDIRNYPKSFWFDKSRKLFYEKLKAYSDQNIIFAGQEYTIRQARKSKLLRDKKLYPIDEGIDVNDIFYPRSTLLRKKLNISEQTVVILNVAPFSDERKGCRYYLELAERFRLKKNIVFIHVGFDGNTDVCPDNYIPISYVTDQDELAEYYSIADLFICTSYAETVADTCLEALACGTRVLAFDACGMPDCIVEGCGFIVPVGDVDSMVKIVEGVLPKDEETIRFCREYAVNRFDSKVYFKKLEKLMGEL